MGNELVESLPNVNVEVGGKKPTSFSYSDYFIKQFPYYLSMGMTYDEYWNDDCLKAKYYREADQIAFERKNQELWLQGMYFYDALCKLAPILVAFPTKGAQPEPYPERPYTFKGSGEEAKKKEQEKQHNNDMKAKAMMEIFMTSHNEKFKERGIDSAK